MRSEADIKLVLALTTASDPKRSFSTRRNCSREDYDFRSSGVVLVSAT